MKNKTNMVRSVWAFMVPLCVCFACNHNCSAQATEGPRDPPAGTVTPPSSPESTARLSLHDLAGAGELGAVEALLAEGAQVNTVDALGFTPLHRAVAGNHLAVARCLIENGADVHATTRYKWKNIPPKPGERVWWDPLGPSIEYVPPRKGSDSKGGSKGTLRVSRFSPWGEYFGTTEIALTDGGGDRCSPKPHRAYTRSDVRESIFEESTCLHFAATQPMAELLIRHGAALEPLDRYGRTPLCVALWLARREVAEFLIAKGAETNAVGRGHRTALSYAVASGDNDVVQVLIQKGVNVDLIGRLGTRTPLASAAAEGHYAIVETLLDAGAKIQAGNRDGGTPLDYAISARRLRIVRLLLDRGARIDRESASVLKPTLHRAVGSGCEDLVTSVIDWVAGDATIHGEADVKQAVAAFVDRPDRAGRPALYVAVMLGDTAIAEYLVEHGADVNAGVAGRGMDFDTPFTRAVDLGRIEMVNLFLTHGANVQRDGGRALITAAGRGSPEVITRLVEAGAKTEFRDRMDNTPLIVAAGKGHASAVKTLLEHGADQTAVNRSGQSALTIAERNKHKAVIELLKEAAP
ncbi:MAG TPA: ankyrin repeat domain-containing protein [Phycisphaerae bacterium]|nr:ankyrin repeat domain-containing protein [Phycisphaerae bacterium]